MNSVEAFSYVLLGIGSVALGCGLYHASQRLKAKLRKRKFDAFVARLQKAVQDSAPKPKAGREISELTFRDKSGIMSTVKIVVDHDLLDDLPEDKKKEIKEMLISGKKAGKLDDILSGHSIEESEMGKVQEFVFSPKAVQDMRKAGLEPDEVVIKMLRASGRM